MNPFLAAVTAAVVTVVPGYFIGRAVRTHPRVYKVVFFGTLALMVGVVAWALVVARNDIVGFALGAGFGLINGARHGFSPVFPPLIKAGRRDIEDS
jgi:hypothetical protein